MGLFSGESAFRILPSFLVFHMRWAVSGTIIRYSSLFLPWHGFPFFVRESTAYDVPGRVGRGLLRPPRISAATFPATDTDGAWPRYAAHNPRTHVSFAISPSP